MSGSVEDLRRRNEEMARQLAALNQENQRLAEQVKRLILTESKLYKFQEKLDGQVRVYRHLYESGKKLNSTFDRDEVLRLTTRFVLYELSFERCVVFLKEEASGTFRVHSYDGYYDDDARHAVEALELPPSEPALAPLYSGSEYVMCSASCDDPGLTALGARLGMDEYVVYALGGGSQGARGLIAAGNTARQAQYHTAV